MPHKDPGARAAYLMRARIIAAYGSRCVCCAESRREFLTIDHILGGGSRDRRAGISAPVLYRRIIKLGYPPIYRLLCWNCNAAIGLYGRCPHVVVYEREQEGLFRDG